MYRTRSVKSGTQSQDITKGVLVLQRRIESVLTVIHCAPKIPNVEKQFLIRLLNQSLTEYERVLEK